MHKYRLTADCMAYVYRRTDEAHYVRTTYKVLSECKSVTSNPMYIVKNIINGERVLVNECDMYNTKEEAYAAIRLELAAYIQMYKEDIENSKRYADYTQKLLDQAAETLKLYAPIEEAKNNGKA